MDDILERLRSVLGDRYTISREIGRGGMAAVFPALHGNQRISHCIDCGVARLESKNSLRFHYARTGRVSHVVVCKRDFLIALVALPVFPWKELETSTATKPAGNGFGVEPHRYRFACSNVE